MGLCANKVAETACLQNMLNHLFQELSNTSARRQQANRLPQWKSVAGSLLVITCFNASYRAQTDDLSVDSQDDNA